MLAVGTAVTMYLQTEYVYIYTRMTCMFIRTSMDSILRITVYIIQEQHELRLDAVRYVRAGLISVRTQFSLAEVNIIAH